MGNRSLAVVVLSALLVFCVGMLVIALIAGVVSLLAGCTPAQSFVSPVERAFVSPLPRAPLQPRAYVPLAYARDGKAQSEQVWPRHKFGLAATEALNSDQAAATVAYLPAFGVTTWDAKVSQADRAAKYGIVYFPRLHIQAVFEDAPGVGKRLVRCQPAKSQEGEVRRLADKYRGLTWDLFNEPDNLDLTAGSGCYDPANPPRAYREAAAVAKYWIDLVRAVDPTARFTCCGELNGSSAAYVRGVAEQYRALYGSRLPIDAVSLHLYRVNDYDLEPYQDMLRQAYAAVDLHPDLKGLPLVINEGVLLSKGMDATSFQRASFLLYHWMDWLALPENDRVVFMGWWVDAYCSRNMIYEEDPAYCRKVSINQDDFPGTRLFARAGGGYGTITVVGETWRRFWCNWTDGRLQAVPRPCGGIEHVLLDRR